MPQRVRVQRYISGFCLRIQYPVSSIQYPVSGPETRHTVYRCICFISLKAPGFYAEIQIIFGTVYGILLYKRLGIVSRLLRISRIRIHAKIQVFLTLIQ